MLRTRRARLVVVLLICACSGCVFPTDNHSASTPSGHDSAHSTPVAGGCAGTQAYLGTPPEWLSRIAGEVPSTVPYAVTEPPVAGAVIFGHPLTAGHPLRKGNKILWVIRSITVGEPLTIEVYRLGSTTAEQRISLRPLSESEPSGVLVPSGIDVPQAGCWHFVVSWGNKRGSVDLSYSAPEPDQSVSTAQTARADLTKSTG
jgi:hypothetical protein